MWSPAVCVEFCDKFLKLVAREMKNVNSPYTAYLFEYDPEESVFIKIKKFENKSYYSFLPEWYIDEIERQAKE